MLAGARQYVVKRVRVRAACGCGVIFKLSPESAGGWTHAVEHAFTGPPDAAFPYNGMTVGAAGSLYGATVLGGTGNEGAIYKFTPWRSGCRIRTP